MFIADHQYSPVLSPWKEENTPKTSNNVTSECNGNRTPEIFFLGYKSELEVNVKCMPHTKTL